MRTLLLLIATMVFATSCHKGGVIEKSWFPTVDGMSVRAQYIDLNTNNTERLYIRYNALDDSGVELEKTKNNSVVWRAHVQPIEPLVGHSKFCHDVVVLPWYGQDRFLVISAAGIILHQEDQSISADSYDGREATEIRSLKTAELISRRIDELKAQHPAAKLD